jgi:putative transposase
MKGTRHSEEQIIAILKQGEAGLATADLCCQHGISEQTYYRWKAKFGGMESGDAKKLKQLEDENRKLKHVVAIELLSHQLWELIEPLIQLPRRGQRGRPCLADRARLTGSVFVLRMTWRALRLHLLGYRQGISPRT